MPSAMNVRQSNQHFERAVGGQLHSVSYQQVQMPPTQFTMNHAALTVQKYLKGYIIRKRFSSFAKLFFLFKRYERRVLAHDVSRGLRECFIHVKSMRKHMLEVYVNRCATAIQKVFRGWYVRERIRPLLIQKALNSSARRDSRVITRLRALIQGWRVRKIMKTKEIGNYVR